MADRSDRRITDGIRVYRQRNRKRSGENSMTREYTRDELVARLIRAGEIEVTGEDIDTIGEYFAPGFEFNGPGGFVADFNGLSDYFASVRAGFDDRSIRRGIIVVEATPSPARPGSRAPSSASSPSHRSDRCSPTDARSSGSCSTFS
jgi:hypothetical protein